DRRGGRGRLDLKVGDQRRLQPSLVSFVVPMWIIAIGIVVATEVTANGALDAFGDTDGTAVALYSCVASIIVGFAGTF
ncbi:CmlA/FloR family chloramphenicol efflux MFS transporter, partial [Rhizobium ruizarguesonis]